ncbi:hypothetical protein HW555_012067 [Spodoptera exigua]|uniref:Uncharacterized protein n=1 Tax=Spodoptera exigua TaxID=7107 RepID=A0A835G5R9_SPOEX|nr:hypothetical protein HW555_012067 [Spodoptera exigua]
MLHVFLYFAGKVYFWCLCLGINDNMRRPSIILIMKKISQCSTFEARNLPLLKDLSFAGIFRFRILNIFAEWLGNLIEFSSDAMSGAPAAVTVWQCGERWPRAPHGAPPRAQWADGRGGRRARAASAGLRALLGAGLAGLAGVLPRAGVNEFLN